jgi:hypothetical protein
MPVKQMDCSQAWLSDRVLQDCQVFVFFAPVDVCPHSHHVVNAKSCMRRFHAGEEPPPHPRAALDKDLTSPFHRHFTHQGHGEGLELLGEVPATALPRRCDTVDLAVVPTASSRQRSADQALLVEDVELPLLQRLDMVVAGDRRPGSGTLLRPQRSRLFHLQQESRGASIEPRLDYGPSIPKSQKLSKRLLRCHGRSSSCRHQAPPDATRNSEEPK